MDKDRIKQLESDSQMLGIMGTYLEEFCEDSEDTCLVALLRLISDHHLLKHELSQLELERQLKRK